MKALKIRIKSPEHSRQVQRALFLMGYFWHHKSRYIQLTDKPFLYAETDGNILYSDPGEEAIFEDDTNQEIKLGDESI